MIGDGAIIFWGGALIFLIGTGIFLYLYQKKTRKQFYLCGP